MDLPTTRSVGKLVLAGLLVGAALTALTSVVSHHHGDALTWLGTVATVCALVVAIGIYAVQRRDQDIARQELLDRLDAQDQLLGDLAQQEPAQPGDDDLSDTQRGEVERIYGPDSIAATWKTAAARGREPRLVRLQDGRIVLVYDAGRDGRTVVRPLNRDSVRRARGEGAERRRSRGSRTLDSNP
jgi:hypothetical protein